MGEGMIGEANVLAAFWQRNQGRFCELIAEEIKQRSGYDITSDQFKTLTGRGHITHEKPHSGDPAIYRLTRNGEAAVSAMIAMDKLPKPGFRLTAIPPEENKRR